MRHQTLRAIRHTRQVSECHFEELCGPPTRGRGGRPRYTLEDILGPLTRGRGGRGHDAFDELLGPPTMGERMGGGGGRSVVQVGGVVDGVVCTTEKCLCESTAGVSRLLNRSVGSRWGGFTTEKRIRHKEVTML